MEDFLCFVDLIGQTIDGKYIYRFDFTIDTDVVWGEYFNVTPSAIIPDLQPDKNSLSHSGKVIFPHEMIIAKRNYCFSMQDCIDGIVPLIFSEIDEDAIELNDGPFFLRFGEPINEVLEKLKKVGLELYDFVEIEKGDSNAIDALIDNLEIDEEDDDDNNFDDNF
jgi:hypothetical protein